MNYKEACDYIDSLSPTLVKPGLERFGLFMHENGDLQNSCNSMHIAGTNGKGSVACMLAETLRRAGFCTGRYTGPHLLSYNERVEIAGTPIAEADFARLCSDIKALSDEFALKHPEHGKLTWYELLTAIAFFAFAEKNAEETVLEVGLGGLYDASNVLAAPVVTAIASISLDHTHLLGSTVEQIAFEKAGIMKESVPLILSCGDPAFATVLAEAGKKNVPVIRVVDPFSFVCGSQTNARELELIKAIEKRLSTPELGIIDAIKKQPGYQRMNAAVAAAALCVWEVQTGRRCLDKLRESLANYFWPGRLQYFPEHELILDGAHNENGAAALKESLDELFPSKRRLFILSFYQSKRFEEILTSLLTPGDLVFACRAVSDRATISQEQIVNMSRSLGADALSFENFEDAFDRALSAEYQGCLKVGTGSFATVSAAFRFLSFGSVYDSLRASRLARQL